MYESLFLNLQFSMIQQLQNKIFGPTPFLSTFIITSANTSVQVRDKGYEQDTF